MSLEKIDDLKRAAGDYAAALAVFEEMLAIDGHLAKADETNTRFQERLSASLTTVADVKAASAARALAIHEESLAMSHELAESDPDNANYQFEKSVDLEHVGGMRVV